MNQKMVVSTKPPLLWHPRPEMWLCWSQGPCNSGKEGGGCPFVHPLMPLGCLAGLPSLRVGKEGKSAEFLEGPDSNPRGFEGLYGLSPILSSAFVAQKQPQAIHRTRVAVFH